VLVLVLVLVLVEAVIEHTAAPAVGAMLVEVVIP